MAGPGTLLLLHGLGGSGEGSVRALETELRTRGWAGSEILRPTVATVHRASPAEVDEVLFKSALAEVEAVLSGRVPDLVVGFSFGGLLAAFAPGRLSLAVASPWHRLPTAVVASRAAAGRLAVLQGARDTVVPLGSSLAALPPSVPRDVDPEGGHDFDAWMDRIAAWVLRRATPVGGP